jgi:GNAT superfamily N-acetyltransferase
LPSAVHVQRIRLDPRAVEEAVTAVRGIAGPRPAIWWLGDASTPDDLGARLETAGLTRVHELTALELTRAPTGAAGREARPCASPEEFAAAQELDWEVNGIGEAARDDLRSRLAEAWEREGRGGRSFVVVEDGAVVAVGRSHYAPDAVLLTGGATAERARGRGAYTALVHARWEEAVARGTPCLVTQATAASAPILRRLGFEPIGSVELYRDSR